MKRHIESWKGWRLKDEVGTLCDRYFFLSDTYKASRVATRTRKVTDLTEHWSPTGSEIKDLISDSPSYRNGINLIC